MSDSKNKNKNKNKNNNSKKKNNLVFPIAAAVVIVITVLCIAMPKLTGSNEDTQTTQSQSAAPAAAEDLVIDQSAVSENASFYDFDANGVTVEVFAVKASDGTVRLALNTCQVCNGSPYAYFVQQGDDFICQNCKNAFARDSIGLVHGGCNPVPITQEDFQLSDGKITISSAFLQQYAPSFSNWKKF